MKNFFRLLPWFTLISLFAFNFATASEEQATFFTDDCITINSNYAHIDDAIDEGTYRYQRENEHEIEPFDFNQARSYQAYIQYTRNLINAKNPHAQRLCPLSSEVLAVNAPDKSLYRVIDFIAPYELLQKNNDKAVLLIHGLTDSPYMYHDLASFFYKQGFNVRTLLLPGHGLAPSALIDVEYEQWQQATRFAIEKATEDFNKVYLGGFSTGGALIVDYLMTDKVANKKIAGVMMWSPAVKVASGAAFLAQYIDYIPFLDWLDKDSDIDFAKYESFSINAAAQIYQLTQIISKKMSQSDFYQDIPLLIVASEVDQTVNTQATLTFLSAWQNHSTPRNQEINHLVYYGNKNSANINLPNNLTVDVPQCLGEEVCESVIDISHQGVLLSPMNPYYGINGAYNNCGHYVGKPQKYLACKQGSNTLLGETTTENLSKEQPLIRLTFNPYFQQMLATLSLFIQNSSDN